MAAFCRFGSCKRSKDAIADIIATVAAAKKGSLVPISARKPPTPGPTIKPVLIAADIYPIDLERVSTVVISAIKAVTAGIIKAALTTPNNLEIKNTYTDIPNPNINSKKQDNKT